MTEIETTWDTEETSRIIANDEDLYDRAMELSRCSYSINALGDLLNNEFRDTIDADPYSDVDLDNVDWEEIASEYLQDDDCTESQEINWLDV